jgi:hypothetical protein
MTGWIGGVFIIIALLIRLLSCLYDINFSYQLQTVFLGLGFALLAFYAVSMKISVLILTSLVSVVIVLLNYFVYFRYEK